MKNAILIHGTGGTPDNHWFPWLKGELEKNGYEVAAPIMPDNDIPDLKKYIPFLLETMKFNEETVIVAHSSGCPAVLALLEELGVGVDKVILAAGFYVQREWQEGPSLVLKEEYNWKKIKENAKEIYLVNSDNDPWGCHDVQARPVALALGATLVVAVGEGHMGSEKFNQPYKTFPVLGKLLDI